MCLFSVLPADPQAGLLLFHFLEAKAISFTDFAPRLALACLWTLQRELPVTGGDDGYRAHVLALLSTALGE